LLLLCSFFCVVLAAAAVATASAATAGGAAGADASAAAAAPTFPNPAAATASAATVGAAAGAEPSAAAAAPGAPAFPNPAAAVASRPDLSLLVQAVRATGLTANFEDPDLPLTIFAPTNAAFGEAVRSLGVTPEQILAGGDRSLLFDVTRCHVIPGAPVWTVARLRQERPRLITLLPGAEPLEIGTMPNGAVRINGGIGPTAIVLEKEGGGDITAGRSVIHVIDAVLLPGALIDRLAAVGSPSPRR